MGLPTKADLEQQVAALQAQLVKAEKEKEDMKKEKEKLLKEKPKSSKKKDQQAGGVELSVEVPAALNKVSVLSIHIGER